MGAEMSLSTVAGFPNSSKEGTDYPDEVLQMMAGKSVYLVWLFTKIHPPRVLGEEQVQTRAG